jgi:hypothetical protein
MGYSRYLKLIAMVAGMLAIALAGAWLALSQSGIDSQLGDTHQAPRLNSAINRFVWEFRNCYDCAASLVGFDGTRDSTRSR